MIKKNISILIVCILFLFIYNLFINNIEGGEKSICLLNRILYQKTIKRLSYEICIIAINNIGKNMGSSF